MGILPEAFWRLSLREWRMLTESAGGGGVSLPRGVLDEMMERWPDGGRV
nr:phage tail assembly chaperone [Brevundimonas pishanensis]